MVFMVFTLEAVAFSEGVRRGERLEARGPLGPVVETKEDARDHLVGGPEKSEAGVVAGASSVGRWAPERDVDVAVALASAVAPAEIPTGLEDVRQLRLRPPIAGRWRLVLNEYAGVGEPSQFSEPVTGAVGHALIISTSA
jgi:hypothetical protein